MDLVREGQWWWLIASAVVAGIFALTGALIGARLGKVNEHSQARRNERVEAYTDFLRAINGEIQKISHLRNPQKALLEFPAAELARIEVIGSQEVRVMARRFQDHLYLYRTTASFVYQNGQNLGVPGDDQERHLTMYGDPAGSLVGLRTNFVQAVRKDLGTYAKGDDERAGIQKGVHLKRA